jgi:hypothetical protein
MIKFDASDPSASRLRDQHYQIQDLLISVDELKYQITCLTLERDVLLESLREAYKLISKSV